MGSRRCPFIWFCSLEGDLQGRLHDTRRISTTGSGELTECSAGHGFVERVDIQGLAVECIEHLPPELDSKTLTNLEALTQPKIPGVDPRPVSTRRVPAHVALGAWSCRGKLRSIEVVVERPGIDLDSMVVAGPVRIVPAAIVKGRSLT